MEDLQPNASALSLLELENSNEDLIQQRINHIRMDLDDTLNIFINAQQTLSSISFEDLGERLNAGNSPQRSMCQSSSDMCIIVRDANNRVDLAKSLERLNSAPKDAELKKSVEEIPELNKFFKVITDLTEGIRKINGHQQSITELNQDINTFSDCITKASDSRTSLSERMEDMSIQ